MTPDEEDTRVGFSAKEGGISWALGRSANDHPAIGKVLDLATVTTYKIHGPVTKFLPEATLHILNPVPVYGGERRIGFATVYQEDKMLVADYFLVRDCSERFDLESGKTLYPSPLFHVSPEAGASIDRIDLFTVDRGGEQLKAGG